MMREWFNASQRILRLTGSISASRKYEIISLTNKKDVKMFDQNFWKTSNTVSDHP